MDWLRRGPIRAIILMFGKAHSHYTCSRIQVDTTVGLLWERLLRRIHDGGRKGPHLISTPQNMVLEALPAAQWKWAGPNLKPIFMPLNDVLYEAAKMRAIEAASVRIGRSEDLPP
jgi:hypothetical protein